MEIYSFAWPCILQAARNQRTRVIATGTPRRQGSRSSNCAPPVGREAPTKRLVGKQNSLGFICPRPFDLYTQINYSYSKTHRCGCQARGTLVNDIMALLSTTKGNNLHAASKTKRTHRAQRAGRSRPICREWFTCKPLTSIAAVSFELQNSSFCSGHGYRVPGRSPLCL